MMKREKETMTRIRYIDEVKGLGIFFVVFAHCMQYFSIMSGVDAYVRSFTVSIFFVIAGVLRAKKEVQINSSFIKKRVKSLLIPYVIFSCINSILKLGVLFIRNDLTNKKIKDEMIEFFITGNGTVWFLITFFIVDIICIYIVKCNVVLRILCMIIFLIIPYYIVLEKTPIVVFVIRIIASTGYYLYGCSLYNLFCKRKHLLFYSLSIIVIGNVIYYAFGSNYSLFLGVFADPKGSLLSSIVLSTGIILLFWALDEKNCTFKSLTWLGKNSMAIMLIHPIILLCFTYPFGDLFGKVNELLSVCICISMFCIVMILTIIAVIFCNKNIPWCIGK